MGQKMHAEITNSLQNQEHPKEKKKCSMFFWLLLMVFLLLVPVLGAVGYYLYTEMDDTCDKTVAGVKFTEVKREILHKPQPDEAEEELNKTRTCKSRFDHAKPGTAVTYAPMLGLMAVGMAVGVAPIRRLAEVEEIRISEECHTTRVKDPLRRSARRLVNRYSR